MKGGWQDEIDICFFEVVDAVECAIIEAWHGFEDDLLIGIEIGLQIGDVFWHEGIGIIVEEFDVMAVDSIESAVWFCGFEVESDIPVSLFAVSETDVSVLIAHVSVVDASAIVPRHGSIHVFGGLAEGFETVEVEGFECAAEGIVELLEVQAEVTSGVIGDAPLRHETSGDLCFFEVAVGVPDGIATAHG